ncbi:Tn3 family transposase [Burkholderia sp. Ac-20345]|uniref:Tn3 family transposase n=1 Tax=Burkholderia sp. Ac-20345 TaxID=2703891 RepID=UPI00240265F5|nr:Tn3 family transposase [Burkholderia sp. Ac-20345]
MYLPRGVSVSEGLSAIAAHDVSLKAIRAGWDELLRLVTSIQSGCVSAVVALQRPLTAPCIFSNIAAYCTYRQNPTNTPIIINAKTQVIDFDAIPNFQCLQFNNYKHIH